MHFESAKFDLQVQPPELQLGEIAPTPQLQSTMMILMIYEISIEGKITGKYL